ncbi:hypothetical protein M409DRAFT_21150 [Zasmidium cellare ATCC 36951]|uniref:Adenylate kinase active site lid domain-containing protein n=1 Tax=Zasmidium cellare ATCC 36951 TaxID=1080233 RepID=A0A6A6CRI3_ZASCE|nr:uncharacterized protein M409DRAFT_21150 [Zasmidium cellare ATCC 36951]KAF2168399.1 hypothetical protein M409DRAFT_21150 [Zasmidium cellare ATCC 36951]
MERPITKYTPINITLMLGPPGSGKGTLAHALVGKLVSYHLSVGDWLRFLCTYDESITGASGEALGGLTRQELKAYLYAHELVPAETVVAIVWHKIGVEIDNGHETFLIDGFPRDEASAWHFEQLLAANSLPKPARVISLSCPKQICKTRFPTRRRAATDSEAVFEKRYREFMEKTTREVLNRYAVRLVKVETSGTMEENVWEMGWALGWKGAWE